MATSMTFGTVHTWESSPLLPSSRTREQCATQQRPGEQRITEQRPASATGAAPENSSIPALVEQPSTVNINGAVFSTSTRRYILADADSFYASCERVFHPELAHKPVLVLSNNDGCVVTRTAEAKPYIPKGVPWFQIRETALEHGAVARSSNYELYGSISARMMNVMHEFFEHQEVYSIDECFLETRLPLHDALLQAHRMRQAVWQGVGIPLSIGIAPTKTLAKIVNHWVKHGNGTAHIGTWDQFDADSQRRLLQSVPIDEVWGVGRRLTRKLSSMGIISAWDLSQQDPNAIRHRFSVLLQRTVLELRGIACIEDEVSATTGARKDQILCSRMFGHPITGRDTLCQAFSVYAQDACRRLRRQNGLATSVGIFAGISPYNPDEGGVPLPLTIRTLPTPSDDPLYIVKFITHELLPAIDPSTRFIRAGVLLSGLIPSSEYHPFEQFKAQRDDSHIGQLLDSINRRYGDHSIGIGYGGVRGTGRAKEEVGASWNMKRAMLSSRSTTRWEEIMVVKAN